MKRLRKIMFLACLGLMLCVLSACFGGKGIDLNKYVTIESEGYDTVGTARAVFDYDAFYDDYKSKIKISKKYQNTLSSIDLIGFGSDAEMMIKTCVDFSLNKSNELSNGDTITLKWICDEDAAKEGYGCKLKYSDIEFKVDNLEEVTILDPFDGLAMNYSGIAPQGMLGALFNDSKEEFLNVKYQADNMKNLSNGDKIIVSATVSGSMNRFIEQYGCILSPMEKEYTVEGLPAYAESLNEIPEDALNKMQSQAKDLLANKIKGWAMNNSEKYTFNVDNVEPAGYYFFSGKEGFEVKPHNKICCVFKVSATGTAYGYEESREGKYRKNEQMITVNEEFYTCCELDDVILMDDGTCSFDLSAMSMTRETCKISDQYANDYGYRLNGFTGYYWCGFSDLDSMFSKYVTTMVDKYNYEDTVK